MKLKNFFSRIGTKIRELDPKVKRILLIVICLAVVAGTVIATVSIFNNRDKGGNGGGNGAGGSIITGDGNTEYTVKVQTVGGMPLEGIMVYIHNGDGYSVCTAPAETDSEGIAKFTLKTSDGYSVQIDGAPKGYSVKEGLTKDDRYPLVANGTLITLASAPITTGGFSSSYDLGDVMYDFTLTDINGDSYKLSELLKTKDMVMLNFWYRDCSNCANEFPYVNTVYEAYKDDIEILAINDYPSDTEEIVKNYPTFLGEDLKMPLIKVDNTDDDLTLSKFPSEGYPTTVIIDRYGVITMIEVGAVLGESKWKNIFDFFIGDDYKQQLITDTSILNPRIEPTIQWTDELSQQITDAFGTGDITVSYHPETNEKDAKYAWPFITDTFRGETVIRPSNKGIDNSYAILYAEVSLKPGQAILFDYFSSTQRDDYGSDVLYILVDGKDIYSIAGISDEYETCCTYVDPRPVTESNKNDVATYSVAFTFYKDTVDAEGDDTIYLKNLRVISANDIPVETYIFRYAATDINSAKDGYNTYADVYLAPDGYYRVGDPSMGNNAPLLLANHLGYTQFDSEKTISERVYGNNYTLMVGDVNKFNDWLTYGNAAANSQVAGYTPVTAELKEMLVAYCDAYRNIVGKAASENLWLQLCVYYDAYGVDENGDPTKQLENPIKGLTAFSAYEVEITNPNPTEIGEIVASAEVTYNMVVMPRGYLYRFVPVKSGAYRITSKSDKEVNAWIFVDSENWDVMEGVRTILTSDEVGERHCTDLLIDPDKDGIYEHDNINTSIVAYMEAGKEYFIDIAYYDVYETGTFTFDVKWIGDSYRYFIQASPGPITYIESVTGGMGQLVAGGIDVDFKAEGGIKYAYHVLERDGEGNVTKWGEKIYADFYYPTTLFPTQSIETLIKANAFNYTVSERDREALMLLDGIRLDGKKMLIAKWIKDGTVADDDAGEAKWKAEGLDDVVRDYYDGDFDASYTAEQQEYATYVWNEGYALLEKEWGNAFDTNWSYYQMDDVRAGVFHNTDNRTDKDLTAIKYLEIYNTDGKAELKATWDDVFSSILPPAGENVSDVSEWRFNYFWEYYQMDDIQNGIYHGNNVDYTATVSAYVALMENDAVYNPERQGCVAVTEELAQILDTLVAREVFENVQNGWLKFCYYYQLLGE